MNNYIKNNCINPTRELVEKKNDENQDDQSIVSEFSSISKNEKRQTNNSDNILQSMKKIKTSISNESIDQI